MNIPVQKPTWTRKHEEPKEGLLRRLAKNFTDISFRSRRRLVLSTEAIFYTEKASLIEMQIKVHAKISQVQTARVLSQNFYLAKPSDSI